MNKNYVYQLTKQGHLFMRITEEIDSLGRLHLKGMKRSLPQEFVSLKEDDNFQWGGCRWFFDEELVRKIIHKEVEKQVKDLPSSKEVKDFWKEFHKKTEEI